MSIATPANEPLSDKTPLLFEEYFELGHEETVSPFITRSSKRWGANLSLKSSLLATLLLILSFGLSFYPPAVPFSYILLGLVYFLVGIPPLIESCEELATWNINIDILMTFAAFSSVLIGSGMEGGLLLVLFALSGSMEDFVTSKAKNSISSLHKLSPTKACVIEANGVLLERSIRDVKIGNQILVRSGQIVPLDGVVIEGVSSVNLVHLTGESLPITKKVGDEVHAGARNLEGTLTLRVARTSSDSTLAKIIELVTQAQEERPVLQRWFDRLSRNYAIGIILASVFFALTLPLILQVPFFGVEGSVYRALAFLIAASPCALIIAIPIAYLSAIGSCARKGILLKGGITLDALARCSLIAFDKTGTLTTGQLELKGIEPIGESATEQECKEALQIAYALERNAVHPIAKAVVTYAESHQLPTLPLKQFEAVPGYGLRAVAATPHGDLPTYIGKLEHILPLIPSEKVAQLTAAIDRHTQSGELIAVLLIGSRLYLLSFLDTVRPDLPKTLLQLKELDMRLAILTGDRASNANRVAKEVGIEECHAEMTPETKLHYIGNAAVREGIAMVGDGINDAPALARATVGICMGKVGSTAAIDAADIVLLNDNIELLSWLVRKSRNTRQIVTQNLILASAAILLASTPALLGLVPLWLAVVLHEGGTVIVGLNGLRLLK